MDRVSTNTGSVFNFPQSDVGNAERFAVEHVGEARYCRSTDTWLVWTGERWHPDPVRLQQMAKETIRNLYREGSELSSDDERRKWMKFALAMESGYHVSTMLTFAKNEPGIPITEADLDRDPMLFNVQNGTLDLRTGELRPHRREDFITKISPVTYDQHAKCPQWLRFLA